MYNKILTISILYAILWISSCGESENVSQQDYIERFNATVKEIRDFPPKGKDLEKYFYIIKNVPKLEDAEIFFFPETHNHALNQLWSAGALNRLVRSGDVVLFEGGHAGTPVDVEEQISTGIFAAREYEKLKSHKPYKPIGISKISNKYYNLFNSTRNDLALDELNLKGVRGYFWDLFKGKNLDPDLSKRNESMVATIDKKLTGDARVFIIAGALHVPHYEFAHIMNFNKKYPISLARFTSTPGANVDKINDVFYEFFNGINDTLKTDTKSIFNYLKNKKFAILIPRNLPGFKELEAHFPKNAI